MFLCKQKKFCNFQTEYVTTVLLNKEISNKSHSNTCKYGMVLYVRTLTFHLQQKLSQHTTHFSNTIITRNKFSSYQSCC